MSTQELTVYEKPTCTKCRELNKLLTDRGIDFDKVNYYVEPLTAAKIGELVRKMGIPARDLLRKSEAIYSELGLAKADLPEAEIIKLMAKHPDLMQRPIVERGQKAVLARPVENVEKIL